MIKYTNTLFLFRKKYYTKIITIHRSLARVGYATQPSLGDDSVNIIIFTYISMGFVKLKIKVSPGLNFSC